MGAILRHLSEPVAKVQYSLQPNELMHNHAESCKKDDRTYGEDWRKGGSKTENEGVKKTKQLEEVQKMKGEGRKRR